MRLIDTHCHLDFPDFDTDRKEVIKRAEKNNIVGIINVTSSIESCKKTSKLIGEHDFIYGSIGIHPHDAKFVTNELISSLKEMAKNKKIVAIGETGLDYYRNLSPKDKQIEVFLQFIHLSKELNLPLIIHSRNSLSEVLDILTAEIGNRCRGVIHCFSGDAELASRALDMGLNISFTCNVTFQNAGRLRDLAKDIPLSKLLLETDAPFMSPQLLRGKRNEPAYITHLVETLARLKGLPGEKIADETTNNAVELFKLDVL